MTRRRMRKHRDEDVFHGRPEPLNVRAILAKAATMSGNAVDEPSAIRSMMDREDIYQSAGAVTPDYDPEALLRFVEISPHLSPNIAAYAQNIEGYGHQAVTIEPWMDDLSSEEARDAIRQAMIIERWAAEEEAALAVESEKAELREQIGSLKEKRNDAVKKGRTSATIRKWDKQLVDVKNRLAKLEPQDRPEDADDPDLSDEPIDGDGMISDEITEEEVDAKIRELEIQLRRERFAYNAFFESCCSNMSFIKLRRNVRTDIESHGWGCFEMLRDRYNRLKRLAYVPGYTVRPLEDDGDLVDVVENDAITPLSVDREIIVQRRFQIYVQIVNDRKVYFKSPGDPRVVSRITGKVYKSADAMRASDDEGDNPVEANELVYISLHSPKTQCPPPRWIGNLLQVLGGREADETNYYYLKNDAIPYGLLFVSGGTIPGNIKERLESKLSTEMRGSEGAGKVLVIQATPMGKKTADGPVVLPQIEFRSLRGDHETDALFTGYDVRGGDRIGASFRMPPMLRGYTPSNLNRATAIASILFAESQVFQPERDDIDWILNKWIVPEIGGGIRLLKMVSNSPPTRGVDELSEVIRSAAPQGGLLPNEIRALLAEMLNKPMAKIREEWARQPMAMTLAGVGAACSHVEPDVPSVGSSNGEESASGGERSIGDLARTLSNFEAKIRGLIAEELNGSGFNASFNLIDKEE